MIKQCEYSLLDLIGSRALHLSHEVDMTSPCRLILTHCDDCCFGPRVCMLLAQIFWPKWETHPWGCKEVEGRKVLCRLVM